MELHNKDIGYLKNLATTLNFEIMLSNNDEYTIDAIKTLLE